MPYKDRFTREQKIGALRFARHRIKTKVDEFLCFALPSSPVGEYLKRYVREELQESHEFSAWLCLNRPELHAALHGPDLMPCSTYDDKIRKLRIQWIDWMIENAT
jgi:hypothetical protein